MKPELQKLKSIIGSCTCLTKTPDKEFHHPDCEYRKLMEQPITDTPITDAAEVKPPGQTIGDVRVIPLHTGWVLESAANRLAAHAELTVKHLEARLRHRGWGNKRQWEIELLRSAYAALGRTPPRTSVLSPRRGAQIDP